MKKIVDISVAIVFILFALVQWNDPDPLIWILMYLCVAAIPIMKLLGKRIKYYEYGLFLLLMIGLATYLPSIYQWLQDGMPSITTEMKADTPYVEWVREALGLLISVVAVVLYQFKKP
jgi:hypothetical protein